MNIVNKYLDSFANGDLNGRNRELGCIGVDYGEKTILIGIRRRIFCRLKIENDGIQFVNLHGKSNYSAKDVFSIYESIHAIVLDYMKFKTEAEGQNCI